VIQGRLYFSDSFGRKKVICFKRAEMRFPANPTSVKVDRSAIIL